MEHTPMIPWHRAISLMERTHALDNEPHPQHWDKMQAEKRLKQWRNQPPFDNEQLFQQRLEADALTLEQFLYLLGETDTAIAQRIHRQPKWLEVLLHSISASPTESKEGDPSFLSFAAPLIREAFTTLATHVNQLAATHDLLPFNPTNSQTLVARTLPQAIMPILNKTMVLELNVARMKGVLTGQSAPERFSSFCELLHQSDYAFALHEEYPVLSRLLVERLAQWVAYHGELLQRLSTDWQEIQARFNLPATELEEIRVGVGDTHNHGRSVAILKFTSGFQLVYKPRSMSVDVHFQDLLTWMNTADYQPAFPILTVLDKDEYGWVEYVEHQACTETGQVQRFYQRLGGYLALLYMLEATDFHYENLIARGEYPILVDLEALFHPRLSDSDGNEGDIAQHSMGYSVLRIGLLPYKVWGEGDANGVDVSGMSNAEKQVGPRPVVTWEGAGTDEMRAVLKQIEIPGGTNSPTLGGTRINVLDYATQITQGFVAAYQFLVAHKAQLLAPDGPITRFAEDEVRCIVRPTRLYALMLRDSYHPDMLRNALDRDQYLDRLWAGVKDQRFLRRLIPYERIEVERGDIPKFTTRPASTSLWTSEHLEIPNLLQKTGLESVLERIQHLGIEDLERQVWFINGSLATIAINKSDTDIDGQLQFLDTTHQILKELHAATLPTQRDTTGTFQERCLAEARLIGDRLEKLAIRSGDKAEWIGLKAVDEYEWALSPLGADIYDGLPGVLLFLAYLSKATGDERYKTLAHSGLNTLLRQIDREKSTMRFIGAYTGWGSILYCLAHLGVVWNEPKLLAKMDDYLEEIIPLIEQDEALDVLTGSAGCIAVLVGIHQIAPAQKLIDIATRCGDRLVARLQHMEHGVGWMNHVDSERPLTGFSHGVAGIAWALLKLAGLTQNDVYREIALQGIAYEQSTYTPARSNWPDYRVFPHQNNADTARQVYMTAWCHGASGIGLGRLAIATEEEALVRGDIEAAVQATLAYGFRTNHSLCHGSLGNLELLLCYAETFNDATMRTQVQSITEEIIHDIQTNGWRCGVPQGIESPGLMTGIAGIGYAFLRLVYFEQVPSVLLLEMPFNA